MSRYLAVALITVVARAASLHDSTTGSKSSNSHLHVRGLQPRFGFDPDTSKACSLWYDNEDDGISCENMPASWDITEEQWRRWNPSIAKSCDNFVKKKSYCIEVNEKPSPDAEPRPETTLVTPTSTALDVPTTTPKKPSNGVETPSPIQPGMIDNCNRFYKVRVGDNCQAISDQNGISLDDFLTWNPQVGGRPCSSLWADAYVCVSVLGSRTPTKRPSGTDEKPSPVQEGMVQNCHKFHKVARGDSCVSIADRYNVALEDFVAWNPFVGSECRGMLADYHVCVGIPGYQKKPSPRPDGPSPTQDGISAACDQYHKAISGDTCWGIVNKYKGLTSENFQKWNPAVKSDCTGLWAGYYYCVNASPAFHAKLFYHADCSGAVNGDVQIATDSDGICVDSNCATASIDVAAAGLCPDGQVQISYWERPGCRGKWFGYGYASRGTCRTLWTEGWKFKAMHLRCARAEDDCMNKGSCAYDSEPVSNLC